MVNNVNINVHNVNNDSGNNVNIVNVLNKVNNIKCKSVKSAPLAHHWRPIFGPFLYGLNFWLNFSPRNNV